MLLHKLIDYNLKYLLPNERNNRYLLILTEKQNFREKLIAIKGFKGNNYLCYTYLCIKKKIQKIFFVV